MIFAEYSEKDNSNVKKRTLIKSTNIKCNTCDAVLGDFIETLPVLSNGIEVKNVYVCPCGGESFVIKTKHTAFLHSSDGLVISSISNSGNNKYRCILERHNHE